MRVLVLVALLVLAGSRFGVRRASAQFRVDTVHVDQVRTTDTGHYQMSHSPSLALGLSAILPGAGQVYLGQWWKVPIIYAGLGGLLYGAYIQNVRYHYIGDSVTNQTARGDLAKADAYASAREFYRDDRDKFYIYSALVYVANLLDAYISAELYDFDVSDEGRAPVATSRTPAKMLRSDDSYGGLDHHLTFNFHLHL